MFCGRKDEPLIYLLCGRSQLLCAFSHSRYSSQQWLRSQMKYIYSGEKFRHPAAHPDLGVFRKGNWELESCLPGTHAYCSLPLKQFPSGPAEFGLACFNGKTWGKRSRRSRNYFAGYHQNRAP